MECILQHVKKKQKSPVTCYQSGQKQGGEVVAVFTRKKIRERESLIPNN